MQTIIPKPSSKLSSPKHSSFQFSFPKSSRFPAQKENDAPALLILPSTLSKKSCTFGFGRRQELISQHCRDSPSPDSYILKGSFSSVNHSLDYSRQKVKERELFYIKPVPGPGSYTPSETKLTSPRCFADSKSNKSESFHTGLDPIFSLTRESTIFELNSARSKKNQSIDEKIRRIGKVKNRRSISLKVNRIIS